MDPSRHRPSVVLPLIPEDLDLACDRDGLNRPLDMVLSAKLQDMKTATAVRWLDARNVIPVRKPRGGWTECLSPNFRAGALLEARFFQGRRE
jgi:hypothetical protein